jgi:lipocalin
MRKLLLILGLISLLGGCGGGGTDPIETPKLSLNPFLGAWYNIAPNPVCGFEAQSYS